MNEAIETILAEGGYTRRDVPLYVFEHPYEFEGAFSGPGDREELILLADAGEVPLDALARRMRSLTIALDHDDRWRPVTLVCWGLDEDDSGDLERIRQSCRVLVINDETELDESLRPLLPLSVPSLAQDGPSALERVKESLEEKNATNLSTKLLRAAKQGEENVRETFIEHVNQIFDAAAQELEHE